MSQSLIITCMDRIWGSQGAEALWFRGGGISYLLYADDVVLLPSSGGDLQWFAAECEAAGMRISTSKSETVVLSLNRVGCLLGSSEVLPQVEEFNSSSQVKEEWSRRSTGGSVDSGADLYW